MFLQDWTEMDPCSNKNFVCVCLPVDGGGRLVPRVIGDPDMTLMELNSDWLVVSVVKQDAIVLCCWHLKHTHTRTHKNTNLSMYVCMSESSYLFFGTLKRLSLTVRRLPCLSSPAAWCWLEASSSRPEAEHRSLCRWNWHWPASHSVDPRSLVDTDRLRIPPSPRRRRRSDTEPAGRAKEEEGPPHKTHHWGGKRRWERIKNHQQSAATL